MKIHDKNLLQDNSPPFNIFIESFNYYNTNNMKHFSFLLALVFLSISANCQLDKRYWLIGGTGNFYNYNDNYSASGQPTITGRITDINLAANIGYFFADKFAAGLRPGIISTKSSGSNSAFVQSEYTEIFIGPFARYYLLKKEKQFNILVDGSYQLGSLSNFGKGITQNASIMAGTEVFFNSSVGIEFLLGYLHQKKKLDNTQPGYEAQKRGVFVSIGFQIHLIKD